MPVGRVADAPPRAPVGAAIILAGGAGRRLGGVDKPGLRRDPDGTGARLLDVALAAVRPPDSAPYPVVVVGPARSLPPWARVAREDPPGGGPAAAVVAGLSAVEADPAPGDPAPGDRPGVGLVLLVAADLPRVTAGTLDRLVQALTGAPTADAAVLLDDTGRRQLLLAAWRGVALRRAANDQPDAGHGRPLRALYEGAVVVEVVGRGSEWVDVDLPGDRAQWWSAG